jgi:hypothetical protein
LHRLFLKQHPSLAFGYDEHVTQEMSFGLKPPPGDWMTAKLAEYGEDFDWRPFYPLKGFKP